VWSVRLRLFFLWLSQVSRTLADNCLRIFVVLELARTGEAGRDPAWHQVTFILMVPAVVLAPCNGALGNSLPKPHVLRGAAGYCLAITAAFAWIHDAWQICWALVALGAAIYSPTRYALFPAGAHDAHVPLTRLNGWMEMGAMLAVVAGLLIGANTLGTHWHGVPTPLLCAVVGNLMAFVTAWPVRFVGDVRRPERPGQALAGFFRDCRRIWNVPETRGCLIGQALLRGLMTGMTGALVAATLQGQYEVHELLALGGWVLGGLALGSWLAGLQRHPRRVLGLVPMGATGLALGMIFPASGITPAPGLCLLLGVMGGLVNVPLSATYQGDLPADARGNGMAVRNFADYLAIALVSGPLATLSTYSGLNATGQLWLLAGMAGAAAVMSLWLLFRELLEFGLEVLLLPLYRIKACGPGLEEFPMKGPLIVIANHSAWLDPMWVAKVLPRRLIPMMTSVFYDLPVIRWLMVHAAQAIRVQAATFRREVPELKDAIAALDRGECLVIFPEGGMRRSENQPLRQFGQGIWRILKERPETPVMACWIEGGWKSYFSYFNGPPTKNKRFDFWRRIRVGVGSPQVLGRDVLESHRATRCLLMEACLDARRHLGLEPYRLPTLVESLGNEED
jgi:1-acyl-sn-glycerol-3-phosphate acyltransferase